MASASLPTPLGPICVTEEHGAITALDWHDAFLPEDTPLLRRALEQLRAYFAGDLQQFDLPLRIRGTDFQRSVCDAIATIPLGETRSYGDLAKALKVPAQAVGTGCGGNPIPIIIPCHRVLGTHGLGGFSGKGGVETKVWLLRHEGAGGLLI
ncbi:methylated-DNA--[protein]-cysteine S-methyltransferase [Roseovarius sp. M141]|uniref:methylated-DNA--[protein]-cysteine S-methyltransferase n=1 Tax=Roseovarius sp. M141 TaxID=2583806 RepID=UPI0020CD374D|nr:methylated-DNA--[protein]-cysteine S-methyltransferase [Roseovarius sp. M141]MCQ0092159.1 methylated-DNA--[protein]-cysteine S-methyltransferase [Roseovarius sp. M141]